MVFKAKVLSNKGNYNGVKRVEKIFANYSSENDDFPK